MNINWHFQITFAVLTSEANWASTVVGCPEVGTSCSILAGVWVTQVDFYQ